MYKLLTILFCLLDVGVWEKSDIASWADNLIAKLDQPKTWIMDLSLCADVRGAIEAVRSAIKDNNAVLPEAIGDLLAGLVLLRFDSAELAAKEAEAAIFDIVDAYGCSYIDAEDVRGTGLHDSVYELCREAARMALNYVNEEKYLDAERILLEE